MFDKDLYDSMSFLELQEELKNHDPDHEGKDVDYIIHLLKTKYPDETSEANDSYWEKDVDDGYDWTFED